MSDSLRIAEKPGKYRQEMIAAYLRVSTEEQKERKSIENQRTLINSFCEREGISNVEWLEDDGVSGTTPIGLRPAGKRLLELAGTGRLERVVTKSIDRLGRDPEDAITVVNALRLFGVPVEFVTERFEDSPSGRFMMRIHAAQAGFEWENIRERSVAGSRRCAALGVWLGGIVPYGYRKIGVKEKARLVVSEEPIPGLTISEADVIRLIFSMASERSSCFKICIRLHELGVPPAYMRDNRELMQVQDDDPRRGKRKALTAGIWRPSRVRNMIVNSTYMGKHLYGKRKQIRLPDGTRKMANSSPEALISRDAPAIVEEDVWQRANAGLKSNQLFSARTAKNQYLLRGLVKCELCGLTYIGYAARRRDGKREFYYRCNGKHQARGLYGVQGQRCPSKDVRGDELEFEVWADIEEFLRNPASVIGLLEKRVQSTSSDLTKREREAEKIRVALKRKLEERDVVVGLYCEKRIDRNALDSRLDKIDREEAGLNARLANVRQEMATASEHSSGVSGAADLLRRLGDKLNGNVSWEIKRAIVEHLVAGIRVGTITNGTAKSAEITVAYRFDEPTVNLMDTDSSPRSA